MPEDHGADDLAAAAFSDAFPSNAPVRLLVFADQYGASQAIAFIDGLSQARRSGAAAVRLLEEAAFGTDGDAVRNQAQAAAVAAHMDETAPTAVILSRFGHADAQAIVMAAARARGTPILMHIDDDLFGMPASVGIERYRVARHPRRIAALRRCLAEADHVIAATPALAERLAAMAGHNRIGWLENGTAGRPWPRRPAKTPGEPLVIGYMGSASHGPDLELMIPALAAILARFSNVTLELFGSIARHPVADQLPPGAVRRDVVAGDYAAFRRTLKGLDWDIGLAPLEASPYNHCKTATKWVEYAEAGMAVIASDVQTYQPMIAADAAAAARPAQWEHLLGRLITSAPLREGLVAAADQLLLSRYGWDRLEASVLGLVGRVARRTAS